MVDVPGDFLPDLRDLRSRPGLRGSLWREPYLAEHTYGHLSRVVRSRVAPAIDVLDLGCGLGYTSLELARDGCRVHAIDSDAESIELARRARDADPSLRDARTLSYEVADMAVWQPPAGTSFDVVVASRVLHHVPEVKDVVAAARGWLRPGGRLVCVEFAYDRFDRNGASWHYQMEGLLRTAVASTSGDVLRGGVAAGIDRTWDRWWHDHEEEHELNTFTQLIGAFRGSFTELQLDWLPYLYWDVLEEVDLPARVGDAVAGFLRELEGHLVSEQKLPGVLFAWVGEVRAADARGMGRGYVSRRDAG